MKILETQELNAFVKNLLGLKKNPFRKSKDVPRQPLYERQNPQRQRISPTPSLIGNPALVNVGAA
jgi:hypothetical protein